MSSPPSSVNSDAAVERYVEFGHELRAEGIPVGSGDMLTYTAAVASLNPADLTDVYWAGRSTMVSRRDQISIYDRVFRRFFLGESEPAAETNNPATPAAVATRAVLDIPDSEPGERAGDETDTMLGFMASDADISRHKSFSACTPDELAELRRIMESARLTPPRRRSRRYQPSRTKGQPNMRRMARQMMRTRHESPTLLRSNRKLRPRPLVLVLDVSGSMSDYSRSLLQFAHSTKRGGGRVEVFCFGTRLTRITPSLDRRQPDEAMARAAAQVADWDGGTRIGDSIDEFVRRWGRRGMSRGAIVVICSDGLDRGDPAKLSSSMQRLSRLCHRIVWMNPHKGDNENYRPNTLGMMVAEPFVDSIVSGHNLSSLSEFADHLPKLR